MNLFFAFFHGEQALLGFFFAAAIVLVGIPVLVYVWLWHSSVSERNIAIAYLLTAASMCGVVALNSPASSSSLVFTAFYIAFAFSLPWNLITFAVLFIGNSNISDREFALVMLLGAGVNTMLIYFAAKRMRRLIK